MGNTVGSQHQLSKVQSAYIAGFLDGDGSINVKFERRTAHKTFGFALKPRVSFSQHTKNRRVLEKIHGWVNAGAIGDYPSKNLSELVIHDRSAIIFILESILPYLIVKSDIARFMLQFLKIPLSQGMRKPELFRKKYLIAQQIRELNLTPKKYRTIALLDPVTTDSLNQNEG